MNTLMQSFSVESGRLGYRGAQGRLWGEGEGEGRAVPREGRGSH